MTKIARNKIIMILSVLTLVMVTAFGLSISTKTVKADYTPTGNICIEEGAYIRADSGESSGLRFKIYVNKAYLDGLTGGTVGATIVPKDYVEKTAEVKGEFTLSNLATYVGENSLPFAYTDATPITFNEEYYTYSITLSKVLDKNYARDFVCVAYVRTDSAEVGFEQITSTLPNGYYYSVDNENGSRSVYQVAYNALNSETVFEESEEEIIKGYVDGVAVIDCKNGVARIANNTANYTSPYALSKNASTYILNKTAKVVKCNDNVTTLPLTDGTVTVNAPEMARATVENGVITLDGVYAPNANSGTFNDISVKDYIGYYGLKGEYGVGTYVDISFTGNNMPYVMLFADSIDGVLSNSTGKKGLLIENGIVTSNAADYQNYNNYVKIAGPNRITGISGGDFIAEKASTTTIGKFAQCNLVDGTDYRAVIGTKLESGTIVLVMSLYNETENTSIVVNETVNTNLTENDLPAGNIVFYAPMKGENIEMRGKSHHDGLDSTFTLNRVYVDTYVSLKGDKFVGNGNPSNFKSAWSTDAISLKNTDNAGYGFGSYLEVDFIGNNLPVISFFNNSDSKYINGSKGIIIMNGLVNSGNDSQNLGHIRILGPNKFDNKWSGQAQVDTAAAGFVTKYPQLSQLAQNNLVDGVDYKLIVGVVESNGNVALDMTFINRTANELIFSYLVDTTITLAQMRTALELEELAPLKGFINLNGAFKGNDANGVANVTEFAYNVSESKINMPEGTIVSNTLKGAYPGNVNYVNFKTANGSTWASGSTSLGNYGLNTYLDLTFTGNNLPIITLFASENTAGIAEGSNVDVTGAGMLLLNGIVNGSGLAEQYSNMFRIYGPYKYGAKDSMGNKIYDQNTATYCLRADSNNVTYPELYKLGQDYLEDGVDYRLILGAIESNGNIALDITFINKTANTEIFSYVVQTTVTVDAMKTALGLSESAPLQGLILLNGAYKGANNDTTFTVAVSSYKVTDK